MISLPEQGTKTLRRRRRMKISNQLAAFAAIMLFASTQVSTPDQFESITGAEMAMGVDDVQELDEKTLAGGQVLLGSDDPVPAQPISGAKQKKRLNLSLFRFRR